jgi:hypothetical protein
MHQLQSVRSWPDEAFVQPFAAGDYGYISDGSMDFANFVLLGNIQDSEYRKEITQVVGKAECKLFGSEHDPVICHRSSPPMTTSSISDERECWLIPLSLSGFMDDVRVSYEMRLNPVEHARELLVAHGASLASKHRVEAQDLILGMSCGHFNALEHTDVLTFGRSSTSDPVQARTPLQCRGVATLVAYSSCD